LTEGTFEWKQNLIEINNTILELLNTYPQLAQYLTRGEYGQLAIKDEGWDLIQNQATQKANTAAQGQMMV
jgi:hypothetical protein